jgi:pimeloyl-ACP methyl ester carboxylesterase
VSGAETATAVIDGIRTRYEVAGAGPPLLMFSPGGFDSSLEAWRTVGVYRRLNLLEHLSKRYTCITFDRRESGHSGGRVERVGWAQYVAQGIGLLDHLGFQRAHLMGGCVGCSAVAAIGVAVPERVRSMVLYSPAGGVKYRMKQHSRFEQHLAFVDAQGLAAVVDLARS